MLARDKASYGVRLSTFSFPAGLNFLSFPLITSSTWLGTSLNSQHAHSAGLRACVHASHCSIDPGYWIHIPLRLFPYTWKAGLDTSEVSHSVFLVFPLGIAFSQATHTP